MKVESTIRRELRRVKRLLDNSALTASERREQYGAMQALSWVLSQDAAAPTQLVQLADEARERRSAAAEARRDA